MVIRIVVAVVVASLAVVWWRDRRHHGVVAQRRVDDGITRVWTDGDTLSGRDIRRRDSPCHDRAGRNLLARMLGIGLQVLLSTRAT